MELVLYFLFAYTVIYTIYFVVLAVKSVFNKYSETEKEYLKYLKTNKLAVIIYNHNNSSFLSNMIKQLKLQDYGQENFETFVILDACEDNSEDIVDYEPYFRKYLFNNPEPIGKDSAITVLQDKMSSLAKFDAYVFLDIKRLIEPDFLSKVNIALATNSIITGSTNFIGENYSFIEKVKSAYSDYTNAFINKTRSFLGLAMPINSDIFVIKKSIFDKIGGINFKNSFGELKYSLLLAKVRSKCAFAPNVKTYINIKDYKEKHVCLFDKLKLFTQCLPQTFSINFVFNEMVYNLLAPNFLLLVLAYLFFLKHSYKYYFIVDFQIVLAIFIILITAFLVSLISAKLNKNQLLYLIFYPIYEFFNILQRLNPINILKTRKIAKIEKHSLYVLLSDGQRDIPCHLELISENNLAKVVFGFKKRKFTTNSYLSMMEALQELILKLNDYGFSLKICQCCKYFKPDSDESRNKVKGICQSYISEKSVSNRFPTLLWNSCEYFNQKD